MEDRRPSQLKLPTGEPHRLVRDETDANRMRRLFWRSSDMSVDFSWHAVQLAARQPRVVGGGECLKL